MDAKKPAAAKKPVIHTIQSYFGLHSVSGVIVKEYEIDTKMSSRLIGIEVEVENHELQRNPNPAWMVKDDGSLRNHGAEWVTRPLPAFYATAALTDLLVNSLDNDCCFSPRTSTHVHVNCLDLDIQKIPYLACVYTLFESLLYRFAGRGRQKNIFCVPVQETEELDSIFAAPTNTIVGQWSKYTGFNLHPLGDIGTVEARHMHGTRNVEKLTVWIDFLTHMVDYVHTSSVEDLKKQLQMVMDGSAKDVWLASVFGPNYIHLGYTNISDLDSGVEAVRRAFLTPIKVHDVIRKNINRESAYFTNRITKGL